MRYLHFSDIFVFLSTHFIFKRAPEEVLSTKRPRLSVCPFVFPSFSQCVCLSLQAPTASCAVNKRNKKGLNENTTDTCEGRDDVLDRDVVHQSHVSACLLTSCAVISERLVGLLFHTALTLGLLLQVCLCVCVSFFLCVCLRLVSLCHACVCFECVLCAVVWCAVLCVACCVWCVGMSLKGAKCLFI